MLGYWLRPFFLIRLIVLIILVGLPLYIKELITGTQEGKLMNFYSWILREDS